MKRHALTLAAMTFALGSSLSWAATDSGAPGQAQTAPNAVGAPSNASPNAVGAPSNAAPTATPNAANAPALGSPQAAAQTAPANWTTLKGTVESIDAAANTVQIRDTTGAVVQVPLDRQVSIQRDGRQIQLNQIQTGDTINLAKKNTTPNPKAY